ncbi:MAG: hypothetical protein IPL32_00150 [Chloracidobacterium sp.]|nr:hypothetical protein [Chloracidobacterium sp.]
MNVQNFIRNRRIWMAMAIMLAACGAALAQQEVKFAKNQQENATKLRQYSWKSRMEVRKDGETKSVKLLMTRHDIDGTAQQTLLSGSQEQIPTGGLKGMIAKKKKEEFVSLLDRLGGLARSYSQLPPNKMERFIANATFTPERNPQQALIRIQGKDALQPGDSMTIWVDATTRKQRRVEILSTFENKAVRIVSDFEDLPNGPTYMARSVIDYRKGEILVTTENFDHKREEK